MTLQQLRLFILLADLGRVSAVADAVNLSQPTVSFHIRSLEEEMGVPLFEANRKPFMPTQAGEALLHYAKQVVILTDEATRVMEEFRDDQRGALVVGASAVPAAYLLPNIVRLVSQRYPRLHIQVLSETSPRVLELIRSRQIDIGLVIGTKVEDSDLVTQPTMWDEIGLVSRTSDGVSPWMKTPISPSDLASIPLILQPQASSGRIAVEEWAKVHGVRLHVQMEVGAAEVVKQLIKSGVGSGLLSKIATAEECREGLLSFAPIKNAPQRLLQVVYHRDRWRSRAMDTFIETASQVADAAFADDAVTGER